LACSFETSLHIRTTRRYIAEDNVQRFPVVCMGAKLHNLNSSRSIIRIIKSRRIRWAGYVARMGEKRNIG
jgi:hypothetical protein